MSCSLETCMLVFVRKLKDFNARKLREGGKSNIWAGTLQE